MKEVKLRRYQNLLTISGLGVIAFSLWSIMKSFLFIFLRNEVFTEALKMKNVPDDFRVRAILYSIFGSIILFDFLLRLYVGLSARAEGFGKKKGYAYIVVAFLIAIASLFSIVMIFFDIRFTGVTSLMELIVSIIVEITSAVVMIELIAAAFTVKKHNRELGEVR